MQSYASKSLAKFSFSHQSSIVWLKGEEHIGNGVLFKSEVDDDV